MGPLEVAQTYFDAWNRRDPDAITATFADGGTYSDPTTGQPLAGQAIAEYTSGLFAAFPDLSLELVSAGFTGESTECGPVKSEDHKQPASTCSSRFQECRVN